MKIRFLIFLFAFITKALCGQNDCSMPLVVCGNEGFNNIEVSGPGIQELSGTNSCTSQEHNSLWFDVTIKNGGKLAFTLKPKSTDINEDFDFFVFGPNANCANLGQAIRCSTTNPVAARLSNNHTGMSIAASDSSEGPGANGDSFVSSIDVKAGERYFIVIDRPIGSSNFTIDWTGTAEFNDAPEVKIPSGSTIDLEECDNKAPFDDLIAVFDLTKNNFVLGNQNNVGISYYENNTDANTGVNPISTPNSFVNSSNNQKIYARLENTITGCYVVSSFSLKVLNGANIQEASLEVCDQDNDGFVNFSLNDINATVLVSGSPSDYNFSYHLTEVDARNNERSLRNRYTNATQNEQEIYVRVENKTNSFCSNISKVKLVTVPTPKLSNIVELVQCDDDIDAITFFNLEEAKSKISTNHKNERITFYESLVNAQNNVNQIINTMAYKNRIPSTANIWSRIENQKGCYKIKEIKLKVSTTSIPANFLREFESCDDLENNNLNGVSTFDFSSVDGEIKRMFENINQQVIISYYESQSDALSEVNVIKNISSYRNVNSPYQQKVYVRVDSKINNDCLGLGHHVTLTVNPLPDFTITAPAFLCQNSFVTLKFDIVNDSLNYTYKWRHKGISSVLGVNKQLMISDAGEYELTVTNSLTGCNRVKYVVVGLSGSPTVNKNDILIYDDLTSTLNEYKVVVKKENLGVGNYEFSIKSEEGVQRPFQLNSEFENLESGKYKLIIRDVNGCQPNAEIDFNILRLPRFFTPNNDGENDIWVVKGLDQALYKRGEVIVVDRLGNVVYNDSVFELGWDGKLKGKRMPSDDYWFFMRLTDKLDNNYKYEGHFSLLRR
ncbi:MAG TPA: hypothetical protein DDE71_09230 [Tenacibaculum sp.]|nr:hypothetical protein [Tenacibaculum sp.]